MIDTHVHVAHADQTRYPRRAETGLGSGWRDSARPPPEQVAEILASGIDRVVIVQALGVFIDTLVICSCTALMILLSDVYQPGGELTGIQLTQAALAQHVGAIGPYFIAVAIFFFAFTSIIGNYSYSEMAIVYLGGGGRTSILALRIVVLLMVVWGALQAVATVFNAADASMGLMATINLVTIVALSGTVVKLTRDYFAQRDAGIDPEFHGADYPELGDRIEHSIWSRSAPKPGRGA